MITETTDLRAQLRDRLKRSEPALGTMVKIADIAVIDMLHSAGYHFVVVDAEHSQLDDESVLRLLRFADVRGIAALLRVSTLDTGFVNRALEAGAAGIQLSNVTSRAQVEALIDATRYAPVGRRSISLGHARADYGRTGVAEYLRRETAQPPILVLQIESPDLRDPLSDIVDGVDVAFHGPTDMSVALGLNGSTDHETYRIERDRLTEAARERSVATGSWISAATALAECVERGERYVAIGSDIQVLARGLREQIEPGGTP
jgi:4-hydroxy-2-oxoheptanedioate aldolase